MTADVPVPGPGTCFQGRYDVLAEVGTGSFGRVLKARQRSTGQEVALKVVRVRDRDTPRDIAHHLERFRREMRLCATLSHPNIVRLMDSGEFGDGLLFAVFEYVPGITLRQVLETEGSLEPGEAIRLMTQVLDALSCAHARGIVHRDLKPENVMITQTGVRRHATVLDFGLGGFSAGTFEGGNPRLTGSGEMMGTVAYAAPEQLRGEPPSPRSDLYSWGLILLECLTGEAAVSGRTGYEVLMRQLGPEPIAIPEGLRGQRIGRLLAAITAKDAEARGPDLPVLLRELEAIQRHAAPVVVEPAAPPVAAGERRQLTVVCCTSTLSRLDGAPVELEDLDQVMRAQQALLEGIAAQANATLARTQPDEIVAVVGYPRAREHDAQRAVRMGLRMVAECRAASARLERERGFRVQVRVGIHSGLGIVRIPERPVGGGGHCDVVGAPQLLAARLAASAAANELLISRDTRALLREEMACDPAGEVESPERAGGVQAFRVLGERPAAALETFLPRQEAPLVGRDNESTQLLESWTAARAGGPSVVLLNGEAGIGKSRLVRELRRSVPAEAWVACRCTPEGQGSPLDPFVTWLRALPEPLERLLTRLGLDVPATLPLLASLLGVPLDDRFAPLRLSPERQRELTLQAVASLVLALGRHGPVVFALEDLHWADPTTLALVWTLVEDIRGAGLDPTGEPLPLLLVLTARPEYAPPWIGEGVRVLSLGRLGLSEVAAMVAGLLPAGEPPSPALIEWVAQRTDGIPLFVEEVGEALGRGGGPGSAAERPEIPGTLRELLTARLDTLSTSAHETVQYAAAIGREFRWDVLLDATGKEEWVLRQDVMELLDARLVYARRSATDGGYVFKHALVRDAAYETMMRATRQRAHQRIAAALRVRLPVESAQSPELLAHHFEQGGDLLAAVEHWGQAGDRAFRRAAYPEAVRHLERALALAGRLPAGRERTAFEIEALIQLGTTFLATAGHADPRVHETFSRALALCEEDGVEVSLKILSGLFGALATEGDRERAEALLPRFERLAATSDPVTQLSGILPLAVHAFWRGDHARAQRLLERGQPLYRTDAFRDYAAAYGWDGGIYTFGYAVWNDCVRGELAQAAAVEAELFAHAERSPDPQAMPLALAFGMAAAHVRRDPAAARSHAERLVALAGEQRMYLWLALGQCGLGLAAVLAGAVDEGLAVLRQGLELIRLSGARTVLGYYLAYHAAALAHAGQTAAALAAVREGLALAARDLACAHEPELLRLEGELLAASGERVAAIERLERAVARAGETGARTWALRAAVSLGRLLVAGGERERAAAVLRPALAAWTDADGSLPDVAEGHALLVAT